MQFIVLRKWLGNRILTSSLLAGTLGCICQSLAVAQPSTGTATNSPGMARFEVASIRITDREKLPLEQRMFYMSPAGSDQFIVKNATLDLLIAWAYRTGPPTNIHGKPSWMDTTYYDIAAKPEAGQGLDYDSIRPLVQQMLAERFHLAFHKDIKPLRGYALVKTRATVNLTLTKGGTPRASVYRERMDGHNQPISALAAMVTQIIGSPVIDQTELKDKYDFSIAYAPMDAVDSTAPSIFAVLEDLGLKLVPHETPQTVFVVDHVDKNPTEN
jgi:uncharacterized protein (TIGR03435 family)